MRPYGSWKPGCQFGRWSASCSAVATRLSREDPTLDEAATSGLISAGNQVATQEGR